MENETLSKIEKQNDVIISLLGRIAFKEEELKEIIMSNSKKPELLVKVYNFCDGKTGITKIAKKVHISQPSVTNAISRWEEVGIVFRNSTSSGQVFPKGLYKIKGV